MNIFRLTVAAFVALALTACNGTVNTPIVVEDGATDVRATQTVNGAIRIGSDVTVTSGSFRSVNGSARVGDRSVVPDISTVNGSVTLGDEVQAGNLSTVNGSITVGEGSSTGRLESVNGAVRLAYGVRVEGDIESVNGRISLDGAHVAGSLQNVNGGMELVNGASVDGDLVIQRSRGSISVEERPRVVIGEGVRVGGVLRFERTVYLDLHPDAEIGGIEGEEPVRVERD